MTKQEEQRIVDNVLWKGNIGYGVTWEMLQSLIQECLVAVKKVSPDRVTGLEETGQLPDRSWVRRFTARYDLVLRHICDLQEETSYRSHGDLSVSAGPLEPSLLLS